ncbi:MAG TPA: class E sortase, partial [Solirubrobacteraceae bacterium]|nr:class E sortase [Solirubrobacteraceae bacterium]
TEGSVVGQIEIPEMELSDIIVAGVEREQLAEGPGLFPQTPMPGQLGNAAIAGHRTTHGQPFYDINDLEAGDDIIITTAYGTFVYVVTSSEIVAPEDTHVIATTDPTRAMLTLTSCHPRYSASQRYIVYADLDLTRSSAPGQPIYNFGRDGPMPVNTGIPGADDPTIVTAAPPTEAPPTTPVATVAPVADSTSETLLADSTAVPTTATAGPTATAAPDPLYTVNPGGGTPGGDGADSVLSDGNDALSNRWFSDKDAFLPVAEWTAVCAAIVIGAYQLAKRLRNSWIGLAAGILPFVVGLYFFYENVNRLLPAAL